MAVSGLSTLNMVLAYGAFTSASTLPSSVTELGRINNIGGINITQEAIDASAIEDDVTEYIEGRSDSGGSWPVTVNFTEETMTAWETIKGTTQWFEVYHPSVTKGWFVAAAVPAKLPMPEVGQNGLLTMEISLVIKTYHGLDTKVAVTASTSTQTGTP